MRTILKLSILLLSLQIILSAQEEHVAEFDYNSILEGVEDEDFYFKSPTVNDVVEDEQIANGSEGHKDNLDKDIINNPVEPLEMESDEDLAPLDTSLFEEVEDEDIFLKPIRGTAEIEVEESAYDDEAFDDYLDEDTIDVQGSFGLSRAVALLPRKTAENLAPTLNVSRETPEAIARFANAHPYAIVNFTMDQLDSVLKRSKVIYMLTNHTINYLIRSEGIMKKLSGLPITTIAAMISSNPKILTSFPTDEEIAATNLTKHLLQDRDFLTRIPVEVHAFLAESSFRHHLTHADIAMIISVHPTIPDHLGSHGKALIPHLVHTPLFLTNLPCKAITTVALNTDIMNRLEHRELAVLARNARVWHCLPIDVIRKVIKDVRIGGKVGVGDLWEAARLMGKEKSLDWQVVRNVFRYQLPDFASSNLSWGFYNGK